MKVMRAHVAKGQSLKRDWLFQDRSYVDVAGSLPVAHGGKPDFIAKCNTANVEQFVLVTYVQASSFQPFMA